MTAYIYADIEVTDVDLYEQYRRDVPAVVAAFGGRFAVRGGAVTVLEGNRRPRRQVLLEFPDMTALMAFYDSDAYRALRDLRQRCSVGDVLAIEGAAPAP